MNRPRRVLIGTFDTGLIGDFALGFRALGHEVTTVVSRRPRYGGETHYDVDISPSAESLIPWPQTIAESRSLIVRLPRGGVNRAARLGKLSSLILNHDVFFFQCGGISLTQGNREYPLIRLLGKKIVAAFMGGEARNIRAYRAEFGSESVTPELEADCDRRMGHDPWGQMHTIRMAEKYADVILSQPNQSSLAVRRYSHLFIPLVVEQYAHAVPCRERPIVVHAPSSRATKGTRWILEAVEKLRKEGVPFEFRLLEKVPNSRVKEELVNADIVIDQLYFDYHGKLTLEALASGCAVASANDELNEPFPRQRPIWHIDIANVYGQLRELLFSKEKRLALASAGRPYVEKYHDHVTVAQRILEQLDRADDAYCEHAPTFFSNRYRIEDQEVVPSGLRKITTDVVRRYGLPTGVNYRNLVERGLANAVEGADRLPRWEVA